MIVRLINWYYNSNNIIPRVGEIVGLVVGAIDNDIMILIRWRVII